MVYGYFSVLDSVFLIMANIKSRIILTDSKHKPSWAHILLDKITRTISYSRGDVRSISHIIAICQWVVCLGRSCIFVRYKIQWPYLGMGEFARRRAWYHDLFMHECINTHMNMHRDMCSYIFTFLKGYYLEIVRLNKLTEISWFIINLFPILYHLNKGKFSYLIFKQMGWLWHPFIFFLAFFFFYQNLGKNLEPPVLLLNSNKNIWNIFILKKL